MFALTPRLTLRPGWLEDAPALANAIAHEAVVTELSRAPWPYGQQDACSFLCLQHAVDEPQFFIVLRGGDPRLIGGIGLRKDGCAHELRYWLTPDAWNRGYATEAARAVVAIARDSLRLPRLVAKHAVGNSRSGRVLAKLRFEPTGRTIPLECRALGRAVEAMETELNLGDLGTEAIPLAA